MIFLPIYVHFYQQTLSGVFEQFFTSKFVGLKMQKRFFLKNTVNRVAFTKLTFRWLQMGLAGLKNTKQLKSCLL